VHRFRCLVLFLVAAAQLVAAGGCATRLSSAAGWRALQPGVDVRLDEGCGPDGASVLSVLYTVVPGSSYAIERSTPAGIAQAEPEVHLTLRATRVLHLAVVLVDEAGLEHEAARTLAAGGWRELRFAEFCPPMGDGADIRAMRIVDRTGALGGQGPVSLKVCGLPLDR
jgi:hypothetical protein